MYLLRRLSSRVRLCVYAACILGLVCLLGACECSIPGQNLKTALEVPSGYALLSSAGGFDVYHNGKSLLYVNDECTDQQFARAFYLQIWPRFLGEVPAEQLQGGSVRYEFSFADGGWRIGSHCRLQRELPGFMYDRLRTGQMDGMVTYWDSWQPDWQQDVGD